MVFMGALFAPVEDRDEPGQGFTHKLGVTISSPALGSLVNTVRLATEGPPWTFGMTALMRNLAKRGLLQAWKHLPLVEDAGRLACLEAQLYAILSGFDYRFVRSGLRSQ